MRKPRTWFTAMLSAVIGVWIGNLAVQFWRFRKTGEIDGAMLLGSATGTLLVLSVAFLLDRRRKRQGEADLPLADERNRNNLFRFGAIALGVLMLMGMVAVTLLGATGTQFVSVRSLTWVMAALTVLLGVGGWIAYRV